MSLHATLMQLLQQGFLARQQGRLDVARESFTQVLRRQPEQPDALQMLAEMAQTQGELGRADELLRRAVRSSPTHVASWFRLGDVLEDLGRVEDAEACFGKAAELKPDFVHAQYNRARLLRLLGRADQAADVLASALCLPAPTPVLFAQLLQLQALLQEEAGQLEPALVTLEQAITVAPQRAALHHNRGVLLQRLARPAQALAAHDEALRLGLDAADAHYNRGNSLQSLGRSGEALAAYRTALTREPQHELALYDIARLRWRLGDTAFTAELDAAAAAAPRSALALGIKGRLMLRAEHYAEAAAAFGGAASIDDGSAGYFDGLGQALSRLGRYDEAEAAHQRAVALTPQHAAAYINLAGSLLQAGKVEQATLAAQRAVRLDPLDQQAWALLDVAWRACGDARATWLNDYRQHVFVMDLDPPPGWSDPERFNQALAAVLSSMHTDAQAPIDQTLRHGSQTLGDVFEQNEPLVAQLKARIEPAVDGYIAHLLSLPRDDAHPLLSRTTGRWRFSDSWSSRLRSGGFHTNHVHSHGWISSCYYVALPDAITSPACTGFEPRDQAGWITFGRPDLDVPGCTLSVQRAEKPAVGRLVLFPSFMWHGTVPFIDDGPRLTIAFDVLPLD